MSNPNVIAAEQPPDFDGCHRRCRTAGIHSLEWGGCEHAPEPPKPTPVLPVVFTADDGHRSLRYEPITWEQTAGMLYPDTDVSELIRADERTKALNEAADLLRDHAHEFDIPSPMYGLLMSSSRAVRALATKGNTDG